MDRDISNWGWGQLLELPDHLFGRRFCVGCSATIAGPGTAFGISHFALPEKMVIWEVHSRCALTIPGAGTVSIALGDHLPATDVEFDLCEQLLPDIGARTGVRRDVIITNTVCFCLSQLKIGVDTVGRRLVARATKNVAGVHLVEIELIVSSVPRSLPEWFV